MLPRLEKEKKIIIILKHILCSDYWSLVKGPYYQHRTIITRSYFGCTHIKMAPNNNNNNI